MIVVLGGVNGAGKSSVLGSAIRAQNSQYYNPDEHTRILLRENPGWSLEQANSEAWKQGYQSLIDAIDVDTDYVFESTLGAKSIPEQLKRAAGLGREVRIFFCGLSSPELHIQRVAERVTKGGHDIPEEKIRERYTNSLLNMCELVPHCKVVKVYDNSLPFLEGRPQARCLFHLADGTFVIAPTPDIPEWAKPIAAAAIKAVTGRI